MRRVVYAGNNLRLSNGTTVILIVMGVIAMLSAVLYATKIVSDK